MKFAHLDCERVVVDEIPGVAVQLAVDILDETGRPVEP